MGSLITNYRSRGTEPCEDVLVQEFQDHSGIICWSSNCFHQFGHIIDCQQDVLLTKRRRKWPHKVNSPNIKNLLQNICQRQLMTLRNVSHTLAPVISLDKDITTPEESWPIKTTLKYLYGGLSHTEMPSIRCRMTRMENIMNFFFGNTPLNDLVIAPFKQKRLSHK